MKRNLSLLLTAAALAGASAGHAYEARPGQDSAATVEFLEPENYTDFRLSEMGGEKEQADLERQLRDGIERLAERHLPPGFHLTIRFRDIDLAGDFEPFRSGPWHDIRMIRPIYPPRLKLEFAVTNAAGEVVLSGERQLSDPMYTTNLQRPRTSSVMAETELLDGFVREIARSLS